MKTSYATEIWFDIRPLALGAAMPARLDRWLVRKDDPVGPGLPLAQITIGGTAYQLVSLITGRIDLIQTEAGEELHPGIVLLQITHDAPVSGESTRLVRSL
jgi:hypothetical protein